MLDSSFRYFYVFDFLKSDSSSRFITRSSRLLYLPYLLKMPSRVSACAVRGVKTCEFTALISKDTRKFSSLARYKFVNGEKSWNQWSRILVSSWLKAQCSALLLEFLLQIKL